MKDLIERQVAIDIASGYAEQLNGYIGTPNDSEVYAYARGLILSIERNINAVPSAQPEIIRCKDCKRVHKYHDPFGNPIYVDVRVGDKTVSIKADDLQKALDYVTEHGEEVTIKGRRTDG